MEVRVLRYFLAVARRQNITRAAEDLHLTQSTLSRQLAELEEELGTQLLERGKRRTTLTEAGLALKPRAEEIIALTDRTLAQFVGGDSPVAGDVWLGCAEAAGMGDLAAALAPLRAANPGIKLHLLSGNEGQIVDRLRSGLLDFGLVCRDAPPVDYIYCRLPHDDVWGLLLPQLHPLAQKDAVTPADLRGLPLIVSQQLIESREFDHWLGTSTDELQITATFNLLYNTTFLAEAGWGAVLCFGSLIGESTAAARGLTFRPLTPELRDASYLIRRRGVTLSRAAQLVAESFDAAFSAENK